MDTEKKRPYFLLFDDLTDRQIDIEPTAAAFQSFETALFLISTGRWPNAITTIWDACEKILRVQYFVQHNVASKEETRAFELQNDFEEHQEISAALVDKSHKLRRKRNDFSHRGYSPQDDLACIDLFFTSGVPYFSYIAKCALGREISSLIPRSHLWFWEILETTRDAVKSEISNDADPVSALTLLEVAAKKVFDVDSAHNRLFPLNLEKFFIENYFQDLAPDVSETIKKDFLSEVGESYPIEGSECPICSHDLLISAKAFDYEPSLKLSWENNFGLRGLWCQECHYVLSNETFVKRMVRKKKWTDSLDSIYRGRVEPISVLSGLPRLD